MIVPSVAPQGRNLASLVARLASVRSALRSVGASGEDCAFWVPGRVEVLGKHTDYAGGRSLIAAVGQGFVVAAAPRTDDRVQVVDVAGGRTAWMALDAGLPEPPGAWARYPATVLRRLARNFPQATRGADISFESDLPLASGMSSSSAFMVAIFLAVAAINRLEESPAFRHAISSPEDLAGYLATIENGQSFGALAGDRGVGTFGGSEDHTAMLCCVDGQLSVYSFCPVRHERQVRFPENHVFVMAVSGVVAEKTGAARNRYNRASLAARAVVEAWNHATGRADVCLADAVAAGGARAVREAIGTRGVEGFEAMDLLDRFDQFQAETAEIVPAAARALEGGRLAEFGVLVDRSQDLAEWLLRNQVPETMALARSARELGALAASAFGAGFGGSVWALVPAGEAEGFTGRWRSRYVEAFPSAGRDARFLITVPGPAAGRIE